MKTRFVDTFNIGDTATIRPYSVLDPAPSAWNEQRNGLGEEYTPGDQFVVTKDKDIYGKYKNPTIYYYFFDDDKKITSKTDKWTVEFMQQVQIPEYKYDNFKCWIINNKQYFVGEYITVAEDIRMLPSCNYDLTVTYDANGGYGSMDPTFANTSKYIEFSENKSYTKYVYYNHILPQNQFLNKYYLEFDCWYVNGERKNPGDIVQIQNNTPIKALWKQKTTLNTTEKFLAEQQEQEEYLIKVNVNNSDYGYVRSNSSLYDKIKVLSAFSMDSDFYDFDYWMTNTSQQQFTNNPISIDFEDEHEIEITAFFKLGDRHTTLYCSRNEKSFIRPKKILSKDDVGNTSGNYNLYIKGINVGSCAEKIDSVCFKRCYSIKRVTGFENISEYGISSFAESKFNSVSIFNNENNLSLLDYSFYNTHIDHLSIFPNITFIGNNAFGNCHYIENIQISCGQYNQVIGDDVFQNCHMLTSISYYNSSIGNKTKFGHNIINGCLNLISIDMTQINSVDDIPEIYDDTFSNSKSEFIIQFNNEDISEKVQKMNGWNNFIDNIYPKVKHQSNTLLDIESDTSGYVRFSTSSISSGYIYWGDNEATKLTEKNSTYYYHQYKEEGLYQISIDNCIDTISNIYTKNAKLNSVQNIGSNINTIQENTFNNTDISSIVIPNTIYSISQMAFDGCNNLIVDEDHIKIQNGRVINDRWIVNYSELNTVTRIKSKGIIDEISTGDDINIVPIKSFDFRDGLNKLTITPTVTKIEPIGIIGINSDSVLYSNNEKYSICGDCIIDNETQSVIAGRISQNFPNNVSSIGRYGCYGSDGTDIILPSNIKSVEMGVFQDMKDLHSVDFSCLGMTTQELKDKVIDDSMFNNSIDNDYFQSKTIKVKNGSESFDVLISKSGEQELFDDECFKKSKAIIVAIDDYNENDDIKSLSSDGNDLRDLLSAYSVETIILKNANATINNVTNKINDVIQNTECNNLSFIFIGKSSLIDGNRSIKLYDGTMKSNDLWNLFSKDKFPIFALFSAINDDQTVPNQDFCESARIYFSDKSITNGIRIINNCDGNTTQQYVTQNDKISNPIWYNTVQRIGMCIITDILNTFKKSKYIDFTYFIDELSSGLFSTDNMYRYKYDSYEDFKEDYSSEQWYKWNYSVVNSIKIGNFDDSRIVFLPTLRKLNINYSNCDILYSSSGKKDIDGTCYYYNGENATISVQIYDGFSFNSWSDGSKENPRTINMTADYELEIVVDEIVTYNLNIAEDNEKYTINRSPDSENNSYVKNTQVVVTVIPNSGYQFEKWSDGSNLNPRTFIMSTDYDLDITMYQN